jgi:hypothetical protein
MLKCVVIVGHVPGCKMGYAWEWRGVCGSGYKSWDMHVWRYELNEKNILRPVSSFFSPKLSLIRSPRANPRVLCIVHLPGCETILARLRRMHCCAACVHNLKAPTVASSIYKRICRSQAMNSITRDLVIVAMGVVEVAVRIVGLGLVMFEGRAISYCSMHNHV